MQLVLIQLCLKKKYSIDLVEWREIWEKKGEERRGVEGKHNVISTFWSCFFFFFSLLSSLPISVYPNISTFFKKHIWLIYFMTIIMFNKITAFQVFPNNTWVSISMKQTKRASMNYTSSFYEGSTRIRDKNIH